jgi:hypothetical protein
MVKLGNTDRWYANDMEQLRYDYDIKPHETVVDVGACKGDFAIPFLAKHNCEVVAYEPQGGFGHAFALWLYTGAVQMGGTFFATSTEIKEDQKYYQCLDIAYELIKKEYALIKINIEGGEYELMNYMIDCGMIGKFKNIQVQFHVVDGMDYVAKYKAIAEKLAKTHSLTWREPFVWENWKRND